MLVQHANTQRQHTIMHMVQAEPGPPNRPGPHNRQLLGTGRSQCQRHQTTKSKTQGKTHPTDEEGQDKGFCQWRIVTAEDPFSHTYGGLSEVDVAAFSTTFDKKSVGRRIVAKINTNINEPTISADRSWAYLNFGSTHKHRFF
jgi:hypothetical protein